MRFVGAHWAASVLVTVSSSAQATVLVVTTACGVYVVAVTVTVFRYTKLVPRMTVFVLVVVGDDTVDVAVTVDIVTPDVTVGNRMKERVTPV